MPSRQRRSYDLHHRLLLLLLLSTSIASSIKGPPRIEATESNILLGRGDKYKLVCPIRGPPEPIIEWFKDGEEISNMWDRYTVKNNHVKLRDVEPSDSGKYTCKGVNGFGTANFTYKIVVLDEELPRGDHQLLPPTLTRVLPPSPVMANAGTDVTLECYAEGFPTPEIKWSKDGLDLDNSGGRLVIKDPRAEVSGLFTCTAKNILGTASANFTLKVKAIDKTSTAIDVNNRRMVDGAFNTTVFLGGNTTLQCTVTTEDMPEISWLKELPFLMMPSNNKPVELNGKKFRTLRKTDSPTPLLTSIPSYGGSSHSAGTAFVYNLNIEDAKEEDQGFYVCLGINRSGYSYREVYLRVLPATPYHNSNPKIASESTDGVDSLVVSILLGSVLFIVVVVAIMCRLSSRVCRVSSIKSPATTSTTIASPAPPLLSKGDDHSSVLTPLHSEKQKAHLYSNNKHGTVHSYTSTLPLPPPVLPPDMVYQRSLVYPPGKSRPLPHTTANGGGSIYSDHYMYPNEDMYFEPRYSDPYMQKKDHFDNESGVDLNYSEAFTTPHPNTPNVLNPPPSHLQHNYHNGHSSSSTPIHNTSSYHTTPIRNSPHYTSRYKNSDTITDSTINSKMSGSITTNSASNSPRNPRNNNNSINSPDQYYNTVSSNTGANESMDGYSSPVQNYSSHCQPKASNLTTKSSKHSYARLTPTGGSPLPPYGVTFSQGSHMPCPNSQSQYVVHYNL